MKNGTESTNDMEEFTLAIALLGGVIAVLLKISDFFNNNVILMNGNLQGIVSSLVFILLLEIPIILLFFLFKGISIYTKPDCWKGKIKKFTQALFKLSFIYFLLWIIAMILTFIFVDTIYYYNYTIELSNHPGILVLYESLLLTLLIIIGLILWDYCRFKSAFRILCNKRYSLGEFWENNKVLIPRYIIIIILVLFFYYLFNGLFSHLLIDFLLAPSYLLTGSYSIEEFPQSIDNVDNLTFTIKETGFPYNFNYVELYKLNSNSNLRQYVDNITINRTRETPSNKTFMLGDNYDGIWYLSINTSKLQPGTYMLHAEVTNEPSENSTLGVIKKQADKLFYIAPKSENYSFNTT